MWAMKALPGLALDDGPAVVTVALRDEAAPPVELSAGQSCLVRLVNETGRMVRPQVLDSSGATILPRSLGKRLEAR
jgi:hypothetical protein